VVVRREPLEFPTGRAAAAAARAKAGAKRAAAGKAAARKAEEDAAAGGGAKGRKSAAKASSAHFEAFAADVVLFHDHIDQGALFGMPCLRVHGKAFAGSYDGGVAFKLPPARYEAVRRLVGVTPFDPSGQGTPIGTWLVVPSPYRQQWRALADESIAFVAGGG
jgi:hypothetical protein